VKHTLTAISCLAIDRNFDSGLSPNDRQFLPDDTSRDSFPVHRDSLVEIWATRKASVLFFSQGIVVGKGALEGISETI
jgi:hypothetical protein